MQIDENECPLCCSEFTKNELNFFPCPCGYRICQYCFDRLKTKGCPSCQRPFDSDADKRFGEQYKPIPRIFVVDKCVLVVVGIPERHHNRNLAGNQYFGQYGTVIKHDVYNSNHISFTKVPFSGYSNYIYVKFSSPSEAQICMNSIDGFVLNESTIRVAYGIMEHCSSFLKMYPCTINGCMKIHTNDIPENLVLKSEDIDNRSNKFEQLMSQSPIPSYSSFPARIKGDFVLPPPRLIPQAFNNFIIHKTFESSQRTFGESVFSGDAMSLPYTPHNYSCSNQSLNTIFGNTE